MRTIYRVLNKVLIVALKNSITEGREVQTGMFTFKTEDKQSLGIDY